MNIGIIGLGLIGGSLGLALRRAGHVVIGYDLVRSTAQKAASLGAIEKIADDLSIVSNQAQIIFLATPILEMRHVFINLSPFLRKGVILSDTASTKTQVMGWAEEILPEGVEFIGGHPMAGKERWGIGEASPELFVGAPYCLVPSSHTSKTSLSLLASILEGIGAHPILLSAQEHDFLVAGISHLPMILSAALVMATAGSEWWGKMGLLASTGYRDVSRLASGNPLMSRDICLTNRQNILFWIERLEEGLKGVKGLLKSSEGEDIIDWFKRARALREDWLARRFPKT